MATVNALSVALFNAAAGGYAAEMTANPAGFANAVGPILEKDVSTDALFVDHLLGNLGVTSTSSVYAQAKAAVAALVTTKGRAGAATDAIDFLKAQEGTTNAYATIAADFAAKVNKAAAFTAAHAAERDITVLVSGVTGVDSDAAAIAAAAAAATAAAEATAATAAAAAAAALAAAEAEAAADLAAANAAAEAAATAAAADLAAANTAAEAAATAAAAALAAANATITSLQNPAGGSFALSTSTTDLLIGRGNADQFTGATTTDDATDIIVDAAIGDNDTLTLTGSAAIPALRVINVENVNVTINSLAADAVDATNYAGVSNLSVTRGDLTIGGATLTGEKTATFSGVNAANVAAVTVGAGTEAVVVTQVTRAGVTVNANEASGNVTVTGAATINAAGAGAGDTVTVNVLANATQDARAVSVTTGAETVTIGAFTGSITVTANEAETVTLANASGGATVTAAAGATSANGIDVRGIDASGATITTGSYASTAAGTIDIGGTTGVTDTATISAAGTINLDVGVATGAVDILNLQSNGAAVTYNISSTNGVAVTYTGESDVTIAGNASEFTGATATTFAAIDLNAGTPGAIDADSWTVTKVDLGFDNQGGAGVITVANNQTWEITADQTTGLDYDFATTSIGNLTVVAGDDNGINPAVGTISVAAFNAAAGSATTAGTVTIEASIANFTATSTVIGAAQTLVVTGDEDVTLGAVTALAVNAANSSGIINMTAAANVATVTTGSGADVLILNGGIVHTVSTGSGNDSITVTDTSATSTIDAGLGNDTLTLTQTTAYVVAGGEGNDNFRTGADINAVVLGGNGTDTLTVTTGTLDFSNNTMFALNSIEAFNLTAATGTTTISSAQLTANSTVAITADGDQLTVAVGTASGSLDASGITIATGSTAVLNYTGSTGANTMTGGVQNETFQGGTGADSIEGGDGTDTFVLEAAATSETGSANSSTGMVANLSGSAITAATIISNVAGTFLGGSVTSVAAGTATHLYDENAALNASVVDLLSSIENVTGGTGADYIVGSVGDNALSGAGGADYIDGGAGDDTITGGTGADTLTGGLGADTFVSTAILAVDGDTITDWATTVDKIQVSIATYDVAGVLATIGAGNSIAAQFTSFANAAALTGGSVAASTDAPLFIHLQSTGAIYYNTDAATAGGLVQIAIVGAASTVVDGDFVIVA